MNLFYLFKSENTNYGGEGARVSDFFYKDSKSKFFFFFFFCGWVGGWGGQSKWIFYYDSISKIYILFVGAGGRVVE